MAKQPTSAEKSVENSDAKRIAKQAEQTVAQADGERILATRRERELDKIAGDLPDDISALWMFTEHSMVQEAVSGIDVGRGLLKLKERLAHGEFMNGLEERKIPARTARNKMAIAFRFADRSEKLLNLGRTKLYACLDFDDAQLDALEAGESILDKDLDEIDRMTTREVKKLVQKMESDLAIKDQLLESKNRQIDAVATALEKSKGTIVEGDILPIVQAIESEKAQIIIPLMKLRARALNFEVDAGNGKEPNRAEYFALQGALNAMRDEIAQAMDALYNCGGGFQAAISEASMSAADTEG